MLEARLKGPKRIRVQACESAVKGLYTEGMLPAHDGRVHHDVVQQWRALCSIPDCGGELAAVHVWESQPWLCAGAIPAGFKRCDPLPGEPAGSYYCLTRHAARSRRRAPRRPVVLWDRNVQPERLSFHHDGDLVRLVCDIPGSDHTTVKQVARAVTDTHGRIESSPRGITQHLNWASFGGPSLEDAHSHAFDAFFPGPVYVRCPHCGRAHHIPRPAGLPTRPT